MLIGIDASRATSARRTGTENYSLHLIRALLALNRRPTFRLYFNQPPDEGLFPATTDQRVMPFPRLWTHLRLSWEMVREPPDVLFVPSHVLPLLHPRRSVVTVHDLGYHYHPEAHTLSQNLYLRASTRFNAHAAARIIADSEATRQDLARCYGAPSEKVVVVYPGRDESFQPVTDAAKLASVRQQYGLSETYLLYVGTLQPRKNLVRLVQAFAALLQNPPEPALPSNLQLALAGQKGWLADEIERSIHELGLTERVALPGYVPDEDLPALLSGATAFCFPSLYEGFGLPVLEAMACRVPVVCANSSSLPEVAGDAALLVDPLSVDDIAAGLFRILTDGDLRHTLVGRGLDQIQRFSWARCAAGVLQVLEEVGRGLD